MANEQVYAAGLLNRALDPVTQPQAIRDFLRAEQELVRELAPRGGRLVDFGCGTGRHLIGLADLVSLGVGIDYEWRYIAEANRRSRGGPLCFLVADAGRVPLVGRFDAALCLTNTWGTMSDKLAVLGEMKRLAPAAGTRWICVYAAGSVEPRRLWYANLGHQVVEVSEGRMVTAGGFVSEHFSRERLRGLLGECAIREIGEVGFLVRV